MIYPNTNSAPFEIVHKSQPITERCIQNENTVFEYRIFAYYLMKYSVYTRVHCESVRHFVVFGRSLSKKWVSIHLVTAKIIHRTETHVCCVLQVPWAFRSGRYENKTEKQCWKSYIILGVGRYINRYSISADISSIGFFFKIYIWTDIKKTKKNGSLIISFCDNNNW